MMFQHPYMACRVLYAVPVALVCVLISTIYRAYVLEFAYPKAAAGDASATAELTFFHPFFALLLASYYRVVTTDPGKVPDDWANTQEHVHGAPSSDEDFDDGADGVGRGGTAMRWCSKCDKPKPERAHHCSVCQRCVLKMDHHCPWVGNCVGFGNYKFFLLFVLYAWACCTYIVIAMWPAFAHIFNLTSSRTDSGGRRKQPQFSVMIGYVFAVSVSLALLFLGGFHVYLTLKNLTTIEVHSSREHNPYDLGHRRNWESVMGSRPLLWFLPLPTHTARGQTRRRGRYCGCCDDRADDASGDPYTSGLAWARLDDVVVAAEVDSDPDDQEIIGEMMQVV